MVAGRAAEMRLGCIVMASGTGTRFLSALRAAAGGPGASRASGGAGNKLLEPLGPATVLGTTIASVPARYDVIVSTRWDQAARIAADLGVRSVVHGGARRSDSIRAGLAAGMDRGWDGCLFLPGDQPLVSVESFERLARGFGGGSRIVRLGWRGSPASPVLFPKRCFDDLMLLQGGDGGSSVILRDDAPVLVVEARRKMELHDIDTPDDLEAARAYLEHGAADGRWLVVPRRANG